MEIVNSADLNHLNNIRVFSLVETNLLQVPVDQQLPPDLCSNPEEEITLSCSEMLPTHFAEGKVPKIILKFWSSLCLLPCGELSEEEVLCDGSFKSSVSSVTGGVHIHLYIEKLC